MQGYACVWDCSIVQAPHKEREVKAKVGLQPLSEGREHVPTHGRVVSPCPRVEKMYQHTVGLSALSEGREHVPTHTAESSEE